ncbi:MAG: biotin-dependent carboxyltransferase family protein [Aeromonas sp.]|uniref:5-oxoprolinase subunit C family protein n=1 Tax=Aeromonas sp. TaxID=647 RepID=UPI002FCB7C80
MLEVIRPGLQSTVQDLGRPGVRHLGIALGGALDREALILANRLVGNTAGTAGIELVLGAAEFRLLRDGWLALTGADCAAILDGEPVWHGWRWRVRRGQCLRLSAPRHGMRTYLALDGGMAVPPVMGSRATELQAAFGGYQGRTLQAGDRLPLGSPLSHAGTLGAWLRESDASLRVLPGPEFDEFDPAAATALWQGEWRLNPASNRMGVRLDGPTLVRSRGRELASHGVLPGVIQVPPGGQPIVLLADAQTTGGYPRIGCVIEADLWKLAQLRPGARLRFSPVTREQALAARREWQLHLNRFEWMAYGQTD